MKLINKLLKMQANFSVQQSKDVHNSLHLKLQQKIPIQTFQPYFKTILQRQIQQKSKAVWIHLNKNNIELASIVLSQNFTIHHGKNDTLVLYRWLYPLPDLVPKYSLFYVACGAIVIQNNKVLLIQQANGVRKDDWGVPGGLCEVNEPIANATIRQLKQQTGLTGKYRYMIYFRQLQNTFFGGTDFYFGNLVQIEQGEQKNLKICERQLKGYKWVHFDEVQQFFKTHQIRGTQKYLVTYLHELYKKNHNFYKQEPNITNQIIFQLRGVDKYFKEHKLISKM